MLATLKTWFPRGTERGKTDTILFRLAWLFHLPLLLFLIYSAVNGDWGNAAFNLGAILVAFVPRWMESRSPYRFPALGEFAIAVILLVEMFGRTFHLYEGHPFPYDLFAHAIEVWGVATFAVLLLYAFFLDHGVDYDGWFMIVAGLLIGLGIGAAWELVEWAADPLFSGSFQHGQSDTMSDLAAGAVGALVGGLTARVYRRLHSPDEVIEEIPILYDWF